MATYSEISKSRPKKDDIHLVLAHFRHPPSFSEKELLDTVESTVSISPFAIRPHPKGAILGLRSLNDFKKAAGKTAKVKDVLVPLTPFPELSVPVADRGRRWRISGVPFGIYEPDIQEALVKANPTMQITCLKLETVKGRPSTITAFASFWVKDPTLTPTLRTLDGQPVVVFDPEKKKKKTTPQASMEPNPEPATPAAAPAAAPATALAAASAAAPAAAPAASPATTPAVASAPFQEDMSTDEEPGGPRQLKDQQDSTADDLSCEDEPMKEVTPKKTTKRKKSPPVLHIAVDLDQDQAKQLNNRRTRADALIETFGKKDDYMVIAVTLPNPPRLIVSFQTLENKADFCNRQYFWRGDKRNPVHLRKLTKAEIEEHSQPRGCSMF